MLCNIRIVRYENDRPGFVFRAESAKQHLPCRGQHVVEGSVEDQELRVRHDCAGHEQAENLTHREVGIQTGHRGVQPPWQRIDVLVEFDETQGPLEILVVDGGAAEGDVVFQRAVQKGGMGIQYEPSNSADGFPLDLDQIHFVVPHEAGGGRVEAGQDLGEIAFGPVGTAEDGNFFPWRDIQTDILKDRPAIRHCTG